MTKLIKLSMVLLIIIGFSSGIINLVAMFAYQCPKHYFFISLSSFMLSYVINQDIIHQEEQEKIQEEDETF